MHGRAQILNKHLKCHLFLLSRMLLNSFCSNGLFLLKWKHSVTVPWEFPNQRLWRNRQSFRTWWTWGTGAGSPNWGKKPLPPPSNWSTTRTVREQSLGYRGVPAIPGQSSHFLKQVTKGKLSKGTMGTTTVTEKRETTAKAACCNSYTGVTTEEEL